jgi:hypothetical protein
MKRFPHVLVVIVIAVTGSLVLSACASSSTALENTCTKVGGVLANGPSRSADPTGYAEAQVGPLLQIKSSDKSLHQALQYLSSAYLEYFNTNGSSSARELLSRASKRVDTICPGVTS